jgi:hypothetical protein
VGLKDDLLTMPLEARFMYDAERNIFFLNMEGILLVAHDEVEAIVNGSGWPSRSSTTRAAERAAGPDRRRRRGGRWRRDPAGDHAAPNNR